MLTISTLTPERLKNAEHVQFHTNVLSTTNHTRPYHTLPYLPCLTTPYHAEPCLTTPSLALPAKKELVHYCFHLIHSALTVSFRSPLADSANEAARVDVVNDVID